MFTYLVSTKDELGMAKDTMAAKPMVLYESDNLVALASEEVAIRSVIPHEIDTSDPYDEEVRVWQSVTTPERGSCHPMTWECIPRRSRGRSQQRFFDINEEARSFGYPDAADVDFNKRAEIDCAGRASRATSIRFPLADQARLRHHRAEQSGVEAFARGRHSQPAEPLSSKAAAAISPAG